MYKLVYKCILMNKLTHSKSGFFNKHAMSASVKWRLSAGNNLCSSMVSSLYLIFLSLFMNSIPSSLSKIVIVWFKVSIFMIYAQLSDHCKKLEVMVH